MSQTATQSTAAPAAQDGNRPAAAAGLDLTYGEAENELRAAVRSVLEDRAGWRDVLARTETEQTYDAALWHTLAAQVGCAGLLIPASRGGAGASYREAAVVAEELGRAVAPVPYLGSAVVATTALLSAGEPELLASLASGEQTAALAVPYAATPGSWPAPTVRVGPVQPGDGPEVSRLSGTVRGLADALPANVLLVPADGVPPALYAVQAADPAVRRIPVVSLDMTRQLCDLDLDNVSAQRIVAGPAAESAVISAQAAGSAMLAAEQLGLADRALELTLDYVKTRYQFARPVGSFQAVKHRLADLWVAITQARAASRYAAACLAAGDPDAPVAVALAKAACSDAALRAGQEMVQLHGGIGFTWEHPAHLYLKRAKSSSMAFGTADRHRAALADLAGLPPAGESR